MPSVGDSYPGEAGTCAMDQEQEAPLEEIEASDDVAEADSDLGDGAYTYSCGGKSIVR